MFKNIFIAAMRTNLKDPINIIIGLFTLAVGFAVFIVILIYITQETSYDSWLPDADAIYRIETAEQYPGRPPLQIARTPGPLREAMLKEFPGIDSITRAFVAPATIKLDNQLLKQEILVADDNFFDLIRIPFYYGDTGNILSDNSSVAISRRSAEQLFGRTPIIGQVITLLIPEPRDFKITGIFEDIPANSHLKFDIVITHNAYFVSNEKEKGRFIPDQWGGAYFHTYARLKKGADPQLIQRGFANFIDSNLPSALAAAISVPPHEFFQFRLIPIKDIYLKGYKLATMKPLGDPIMLITLAGVGILVLIIGGINFSALTMARMLSRQREFVIRKILGANRRQLIFQIVNEIAILTLLALVLSTALVEILLRFDEAFLGDVVKATFWSDSVTILTLPVLALVMCLTSAAYPSLRLSLIQPMNALGTGYRAGMPSSFSQNALLVFQYTITIILISATIIFVLQIRFAKKADLGYNPTNVLLFQAPEGAASESNIQNFSKRLAQLPGVVNVTRSHSVPTIASTNSENNLSVRTPASYKPVVLGVREVGLDFFSTYQTEPVKGRIFSKSYLGDRLSGTSDQWQEAAAVVNTSAVRRLGYDDPESALGQTFSSGTTIFTIVGVVPDLRFRSVREGVRDEFFYVPQEPGRWITLRHEKASARKLSADIKQVWQREFPNYALNLIYLEDSVTRLYAKERVQAVWIGGFAGMALAISSMGMFAMATYTLRRRSFEMAIRRVLGAQVTDITYLVLWQFMKPVIIAFTLALPISWWASSVWLTGFAERIALTPLPFFAAGGIAVIIAITTVLYHSIRAAHVSPGAVLKQE